MTEASFRLVKATDFVSSADSSHYNLPLIPWFRSNGQPSSYPTAFTPDIGEQHSFSVVNFDPNHNYIYNKTDSFWPLPGAVDKGFSVQSLNNTAKRQFNYRVDGGKGFWMPCPIFKSASFFWDKVQGGAPWYVRHFGLVLKNWRTDEEKTWASTLNNNNGNSGLVKITSGVDSLRAMGPDWYIYGVVFNLERPDSGSTNQQPKARMVDFRLGWQIPGLTGTNRMALTKEMTWNNLTNALRNGQMKFEPASYT